MVFLSDDAVTEFTRMVGEVFDRAVVTRSARETPLWVLVAPSAYVPNAHVAYDLRNKPFAPIVLYSAQDVARLPGLLAEMAVLLDCDHELAVNTEVVVGWSNGVLSTVRLDILDGKPGVTEVNLRWLQSYRILRTQNGLHFYRKPNSTSRYVPADQKWMTFVNMGAGHIRLSQNTKGPITYWRADGLANPAAKMEIP
jgi:hypothetical protein